MKNGTWDPTFDAERTRDARNVAPDLGVLAGEGALQRVRAPERGGDERLPEAERRPGRPSEQESAEAEGPSYYGLPVLKDPVWRWYIPAYFFTGGLSGACAVLGAAAQAAGGTGTEGLVRRCRVAAAAGAFASAGLLIADLGRPARFLNMLRVFRPTSPMNMGAWLLSEFGGEAAVAALPVVWRDAPRWLVRAGDLAGYGAGILGLPLVGYTGVLIANTAVPVWQGTRNTLPILFAFSGAVSAGALLQLWAPRWLHAQPGRARHTGPKMVLRFGRVAKAAELAVSFALDREAAARRLAAPPRCLGGDAPGRPRAHRCVARRRPVAAPRVAAAAGARGGLRRSGDGRHPPAPLRRRPGRAGLGPRSPRHLRDAAARARRH